MGARISRSDDRERAEGFLLSCYVLGHTSQSFTTCRERGEGILPVCCGSRVNE
jgi:hypothetical protein